ncbi:metallo-mystery pair system four-Cys motif protein [Leptospira congkakensis]|uniref:Metallo-mystery pair system four-Cys motif protein n=1 Tax=Leptospira congkakensis TaxID=2484932 RepID=A0A4Z1AA78_9LEPT|nr:MbnP family copper-binding protein [Leptospira congkakensis]TGL84858.1 metallo-mystery pair system four-Cys motif protein [Leptospira congkakensis]TGL92101.1 metallo-mystery pair system four-Cys motif protein [Leptospira congkakensis]TGL96660.1 metallo-mystery pair system four-Cys motif protein [Leptospira congkakensis]
MNSYKLIVLILFAFLSVFGCEILTGKKEENTNLLAGLVVLSSLNTEIPFEIVAAGKPGVKCGAEVSSVAGVSVSGSDGLYIKDARFYVHDVKYVLSDGTTVDATLVPDGKWQTSSVVLLDFEDGTSDCSAEGTAETNKIIRTTRAPGNVIGLEFKVGVPYSLNHMTETTVSAPFNVTKMQWSWLSGFIFMKFDWKTTDSGSTVASTFHLGSASCTGTAPAVTCSLPNRSTIRVTSAQGGGWIPSANPVYFDVQKLLDTTNTKSAAIGMCMPGNANAECAKVMTRTGLISASGASSGTHAAFYLKP